MRVAAITNDFGFDNLIIGERPDPRPGPHQVLLRVTAVALNYRDLLMVQGQYNPRQPLPLIPCSDGVGEVIEVGPEVTRVAVGDRVAGIFAQGWLEGQPTREKLHTSTLGGPLDGMLAEQGVLDEQGVVPVPGHLSNEEAATLPCAAVTAWSALVRHGRARAGESVLILGTGGVSIFALQIAKLLGCEVIITSSSDDKLERALALGADHGINYRKNEHWFKQVLELTGGRGVDHVVELGGVGTLHQSIRSVCVGGSIYLIGVLAGAEAPLNLLPMLMHDVRLQGVIVGPRAAFEQLNRAVALHQLRPVIDQVFPFEESAEALRTMAQANHFGKICIRVAE